jgi:alpha-tubulin suppressor-like RCC1 family protein/putative cell wall-binding protein
MRKKSFWKLQTLLVLAASVALPLGVTSAAAQSVPSVTAERVAGADRYETSVEVARQVGGGSLAGLDRLIVVTGERFPDGLTASGLAGFLDEGGRSGRTAILLTRTESLPQVVADAIRDSGVPASDVIVVGGTAAVSTEVFTAVAEAAGWDGAGENPVTRIAGADRYETAAAIVEFVKQQAGGSLPDSYRTVLVANGQRFPDALAGGTLAYRSGHLIMLSPPPSAPQVTLSAVDTLAANCAVVLGGTAALAAQVAEQVEDRLVPGGCGGERVGGSDRFETAALVASRFQNVNGPSTEVLLVSGVEFADALTAAPLAGGDRPVLFGTPDGLPASTESWLQAQEGVTNLVVVGGTDAIGSGVVGDAVAALPATPTPDTTPDTTPDPAPDAGNGGATTLGLSYAESVFSMSQTSQTFSPTVTGGSGPVSFTLSGTLPDGVSFDEATGVFTGPEAWNFEVAQISVGAQHTCAVITDGTARCWGYNFDGQLGDGSTVNSSTPVEVTGLSDITQISAATTHTCARLADGTAYCWGFNWSGQLGDGTTTDSVTPVAVQTSSGDSSPLSDVVEISAGEHHSCAVLSDGTARCWGSGFHGRLGDGTTTNSSTPVLVSGLTGVSVAQISAGPIHTCAVLTDGTARCWGGNWGGHLGNGSTTASSTPVAVHTAAGDATPLSGVVQISTSATHTCAVLEDGTARCWGSNTDGQLGNGSTTASSTPVTVHASAADSNPLSAVVEITTGYDHTCAVLTDGTARCWGRNLDGQLGTGAVESFDGCIAWGEYQSWISTEAQCDSWNGSWEPITSNVSSTTAAEVSGLTGVVQISAGFYHTCALLADGTTSCWGRNRDGQLGDGSTTGQVTAVTVSDSGNPGWPSSVTVTATDGVSSVTATITLTKS